MKKEKTSQTPAEKNNVCSKKINSPIKKILYMVYDQ